MASRKSIDFFLFVIVLILLLFGTVMVFSSSTPAALRSTGDSYYIIKKQLIFIPLGLISMYFTMNFNYKKLGKLSPILLLISAFLLVLVLLIGIGDETGARRWIDLKFTTFQPSEMLKISIIIFFAHSVSRNKDKIKSFTKGLLPYLCILGFFAVLLLKQPHLSATIIVFTVGCIILLCGGAKIIHYAILTVPGVLGLGIMIYSAPYRLARLVTFLDPWQDPKGAGWQVIQSLYAIGTGGLFGRGLGKSIQKLYYLPEPHNDFIFAVAAEELGYVGSCVIILLFIILIWRGIKIAMHAPDLFGALLAVGITSLIGAQAVINIAVVTSSMPVTGMPLPFFSYGGTSLIFLLTGVGILLNVSRYSNYERI